MCVYRFHNFGDAEKLLVSAVKHDDSDLGVSALAEQVKAAVRHPADLSNPSGSDSPRRAPNSAVFSVGGTAGGRYGVVS